jgi:iron(III) transport system ATP-binding protein
MEIRIRGVSKYYYSDGKTIKALDDVNLTIPSNRIFTLLGPSGSGKTTLLRCIVGSKRRIRAKSALATRWLSKDRGISVPPEKRAWAWCSRPAIWPHMTVLFDNVGYPLQVRGVAKESRWRGRWWPNPGSSCSTSR